MWKDAQYCKLNILNLNKYNRHLQATDYSSCNFERQDILSEIFIIVKSGSDLQ